MLRGLTTISYWATDHEGAKAWYAALLGIDPYLDIPGYCEFRVGDAQDELGVIDRRYAPAGVVDGVGGAVVYWHVDSVEQALEKVVGMGATIHEPAQDRGTGFVTATVIDPFGNILGLMYNPHYLEMTR